jgi:hypothetical protein
MIRSHDWQRFLVTEKTVERKTVDLRPSNPFA